MTTKSKVSIITVFYNAQLTINRCAESLFKQTFNDIEFIFVDDNSTDKSIEILEKTIQKYEARRKWIKTIKHDINKGVSAARNTGLGNATGKYVIHADSDDWLEPQAIERLYNEAQEKDADIVWSDFYVIFENSEVQIYRRQNVPINPEECIIGMLEGKLHAGLWNKLVRRDIYVKNNIQFPDEVNMCEDLVFNVQYLTYTKNIVYHPFAYYHYVQSQQSITAKATIKTLNSEMIAIMHLEKILKYKVYRTPIFKYQARIKRNIFKSGLFSEDFFISLYKDSNKFIYEGINILEKTAFWFALKEHFKIAKFILKCH